MTRCKAVKDIGYVIPGEHFDHCEDETCSGCWPCVPTTEHGDPLTHCTGRRHCSHHIATDQQTCPRCVGVGRFRLHRIVQLATLLPVLAAEVGRIDSEAVNLAGPATDPAGWSERKVQAMRDGTIDLLDDDDPDHPYAVLTRWHMMLAEDYGHDLPPKMSTAGAGAYIDRHLDRVAQDPEQDYPLLLRELSACLSRLESPTVLAVAPLREVGAPCPLCATVVHVTLPCCNVIENPDLTATRCDGTMDLAEPGLEYVCRSCKGRCGSVVHRQHAGPRLPRLELERAAHDQTGASDQWRCPDNRQHRFTEGEYRLRVSDDYLANSDRLTAPDMQRQYRVPEGSVRGWAAKQGCDGKPLVRKRGRDHSGRQLYDVADVVAMRDGARHASA